MIDLPIDAAIIATSCRTPIQLKNHRQPLTNVIICVKLRGMASVQYIDNGTYRATYKDYSQLLNGKPKVVNKRYYLYNDKGQRKHTGSKREIEARKKEILLEIRTLEEESKGVDITTSGNIDLTPDKRTVYYYLQHIEKPCKSNKHQSIQRAKCVVDGLMSWLLDNYPTITLVEFGRRHAREYAATLKGYAIATSSSYIRTLASVWSMLADDLDGMVIFTNPWQSMGRTMKDLTEHKRTVEVSAYSKDWLSEFFSWIDDYKGNLAWRAEVKVYYYLLAVTGWRREDVRRITWADVNLDRRYIYNKSTKTGAETYLYITDMMMDKLRTLGSPNASFKLFHFSHDFATSILESYIDNVSKPDTYRCELVGKLYKRSHTMHSFRKSVITHLKSAGYSTDVVEYITGHAGNSTESKYYNKFAVDIEGSTRKAVETMESIIYPSAVPSHTDDDKASKLDLLLRLLESKGLSIDDLINRLS